MLQAALDGNSGDHYLETQLDAADATRLAASTVLDSKTRGVTVKIVNGGDEAMEINIRLAGLASDVTMKATKTVLTGPDADAENEDGNAPVVKPEASTESVKPIFPYTAPANSLTVYRINR